MFLVEFERRILPNFFKMSQFDDMSKQEWLNFMKTSEIFTILTFYEKGVG